VTATDPDGAAVQTTVTYTVTNLPPVAVDDAASAGSRPIIVDVLANDRDGGQDGDELRVIAAVAEHGTVQINLDGTITYNPFSGYSGQDALTYRISDGQGGFATAVVRLTVTAEPVIAPDDQKPRDATPYAFAAEPIGADGTVLETVEEMQQRGQLGDRWADGWRRDGANVAGLSSFSLRMTSSSRGAAAVIETFMRDRVLIINLSLADRDADYRAVEWKVQRADGRPLPSWLSPAGNDILMGEHSVDEEWIDLRVTGVLADGTVIVNEVRIQTRTGEIQPLKLGKSGAVSPRVLWDQLHADPAVNHRQVTALARRLG
ncbi:MAG: Ig-like domain-containing protein, partial [Hyphomicrobium sp.]